MQEARPHLFRLSISFSHSPTHQNHHHPPFNRELLQVAGQGRQAHQALRYELMPPFLTFFLSFVLLPGKGNAVASVGAEDGLLLQQPPALPLSPSPSPSPSSSASHYLAHMYLPHTINYPPRASRRPPGEARDVRQGHCRGSELSKAHARA